MNTRPPSERSDWTEQDLLTREEALPRLDEEIAEVTNQLSSTTDQPTRDLLQRRLTAMDTIRNHLAADQQR